MDKENRRENNNWILFRGLRREIELIKMAKKKIVRPENVLHH